MSKLRDALARLDEIRNREAAPHVVEALEEARALLEGAEEIIERLSTDPGCDCSECEACGKLPDDCSGTECAKSCGCLQCLQCEAADALESIREALGR